jgi:hypothetical protein
MKQGVGSGYISNRYGSANPVPHQIVTDPKHSLLGQPDEGTQKDAEKGTMSCF